MLHLAVAIHDRDHRIIPRLVSLFTFGVAYHCELVFSNGDVLYCAPKTGVTWVTRAYDYFHWAMVPFPNIDKEMEKQIYAWCNEQVKRNTGYDWMGAIFGGLLPKIENPDKWFCSELCAAALKPYIYELNDDTVEWWSPELLWKTCAKFIDDHYPFYHRMWSFTYTHDDKFTYSQQTQEASLKIE